MYYTEMKEPLYILLIVQQLFEYILRELLLLQLWSLDHLLFFEIDVSLASSKWRSRYCRFIRYLEWWGLKRRKAQNLLVWAVRSPSPQRHASHEDASYAHRLRRKSQHRAASLVKNYANHLQSFTHFHPLLSYHSSVEQLQERSCPPPPQ